MKHRPLISMPLPTTSTPSLTLHLTPPRHVCISHLLLTSPHGGPIRTLPLVLESGTRFYELFIPCLLLYDRASEPTLTTTAMTCAQWETLCDFVKREGVLKVVLGIEDDGVDMLGRVTRVGEEIDDGSIRVRFWRQEKKNNGGGKVRARVRRGLEWVRGVVRV